MEEGERACVCAGDFDQRFAQFLPQSRQNCSGRCRDQTWQVSIELKLLLDPELGAVGESKD